MPAEPSDDSVSDYRLAPAIGARMVGRLLVGLAVALFVATLLVTLFDLPPDLLIVSGLGGVVGVLATGYLLTRRMPVVHLDPEGYRVRLVRGAGVTAAAWTEVEEAVTTTVGSVPVVVLRLTEGRSTTIPVPALDVDREEFVRDLRRHLQHGQGLRPL